MTSVSQSARPVADHMDPDEYQVVLIYRNGTKDRIDVARSNAEAVRDDAFDNDENIIRASVHRRPKVQWAELMSTVRGRRP